MKPFICKGDRTSHGGLVVGGSPASDIGGRPMARQGDKCTCPIHGTTVIATGDPTMPVDGQSAARQGDTTACGATLIPAQSVAGIENGSSVGAAAGASAGTMAAVASAAAGIVSGAAAADAIGNDPAAHAIRFALTDQKTGVPLARQPVRIEVEGQTVDQVTDDKGMTEVVYTGSAPQQVTCRILGIDEIYEGQADG